MESTHLNRDSLIAASYGVTAAGEAEHLASCAACREALEAVRDQRAQRRELPDLPSAFWLRQRETIVERVRQPLHTPFRLAAAVSLLVLLAVALVLGTGNRPASRPAQDLPFYRAEDQQFLSDIHTIANRVEPQALAPIGLLVPAAQQETKRP